MVVICYIGSWSVHRPGRGSFSIDNFNPKLCDIAIYSFAGLDIQNNAIKSLDSWRDIDGGGYKRLTSMKQLNPRLRVLLAIGGYNEGSENFSNLSASSSRRQQFVKQTCQFIRQYGFDGLDLDWEYPAHRGGVPDDKQNFVSLVRELRREFDRFDLMLTAAIGASIEMINKAYDIRSLSQSLDYINVMTYDYGGHWDNRITANAPLNGSGQCIVKTIDHLIRMGAAPSKLVLGLPFYGRTFTTSRNGRFNDPANGSFAGPYTREIGFMGYNEICETINQPGWSTSYDAGACQVIAKQSCGGSTKVIVYDNEQCIAEKAKYARNRGLGGVMVWSLDTDDFLNNFPLLKAINSSTREPTIVHNVQCVHYRGVK